MKGRGKRDKILVTVISAALLSIFTLTYTVATAALNQESKWGGRIDKFDQYYQDFQMIAEALTRLADGQEKLYCVDKYEPVFTNSQKTISLNQAETASLRNLQIVFSEEVGFLGTISVTTGQVIFQNINGKYAVLYTDEDVPPASTEGNRLTASKIRPHWYHVAYE